LKKKISMVSLVFEPRIFPLLVIGLNHMTSDAVETFSLMYGQSKNLKLSLKNSSYRGDWKNKLEKMLQTCRLSLTVKLTLKFWMGNPKIGHTTFYIERTSIILVQVNIMHRFKKVQWEHFYHYKGWTVYIWWQSILNGKHRWNSKDTVTVRYYHPAWQTVPIRKPPVEDCLPICVTVYARHILLCLIIISLPQCQTFFLSFSSILALRAVSWGKVHDM
jgi:hypothetical protein